MNDKALVSHVGIAVADLDNAIKTFSAVTGQARPEIEMVEDQKVRVAMFGTGGGRVELLEATSVDSPIARFIEKRGEGLHHICLYVSNLESKLAELKAAGVRLIDEKPRIGAGGRKVAFVHPSQTNSVLLELEER